MAGFEAFERQLKLAADGLTGEALNDRLAAFAKSELKRVISSGEGSTTYTRYVNGREGAPEESVIAPGPILYVFANWPLIVRAALAELGKRVPKRTGRYASGFVVLADGKPVQSYADIGPRQEVTIFNVRPYTRKIEVGANGPGKHHYRRAVSALRRRFGTESILIRTQFVKLTAGIHPDVPYVLKGAQRIRLAKQSRQSSAFRAGRAYLASRKDLKAGELLTYPAVVMRFG